MKRTKKNYRGLLLTLVLTFGVFLFCAQSMTALAAGTAKVVASSGKIRAAADTGSNTLASVKKGDKLDVIASKKDGSGYTWYKVYINDKDTGYIRADLVTVEGTISEEKESTSYKLDSKNNNLTENELWVAENVIFPNDITAKKTIDEIIQVYGKDGYKENKLNNETSHTFIGNKFLMKINITR